MWKHRGRWGNEGVAALPKTRHIQRHQLTKKWDTDTHQRESSTRSPRTWRLWSIHTDGKIFDCDAHCCCCNSVVYREIIRNMLQTGGSVKSMKRFIPAIKIGLCWSEHKRTAEVCKFTSGFTSLNIQFESDPLLVGYLVARTHWHNLFLYTNNISASADKIERRLWQKTKQKTLISHRIPWDWLLKCSSLFCFSS